MNTTNKLGEALRRLLDAHEKEAKAYMTARVASENFSRRSAKADEAAHLDAMMEASAAEKVARAALAALEAEAGTAEPVAAIPGWPLNYVHENKSEGTWEIGVFDFDDDRFSPVITVDTGIYYRPQDAEPLARLILKLLKGATPAAPAPEPLTDEQIIDLFNESCREHFNGIERMRHFARAIERAIVKGEEAHKAASKGGEA